MDLWKPALKGQIYARINTSTVKLAMPTNGWKLQKLTRHHFASQDRACLTFSLPPFPAHFLFTKRRNRFSLLCVERSTGLLKVKATEKVTWEEVVVFLETEISFLFSDSKTTLSENIASFSAHTVQKLIKKIRLRGPPFCFRLQYQPDALKRWWKR